MHYSKNQQVVIMTGILVYVWAQGQRRMAKVDLRIIRSH